MKIGTSNTNLFYGSFHLHKIVYNEILSWNKDCEDWHVKYRSQSSTLKLQVYDQKVYVCQKMFFFQARFCSTN